MKNKTFLSLSLLVFLSLPILVQADDLANKLRGRILLQVEQKGEAWYVNPENQERYYLGRPADAFNLMRSLGLGVSNVDFSKFNGVAPVRLAGKILLKVEANGEAYYVSPVDLKIHYLGRPTDAFNLMRSLGLGISNSNLEKVTTKAGYGIKTGQNNIDTETKDKPAVSSDNNVQPEVPATTTPAVTEPVIATSTGEIVTSLGATCEFQAQYFKNINLIGLPVVSRTEIGINNDWWTGKPEGFSLNNEFSILWLGNCDFTAGRYKFTAVFNDAMRVYVDGKLIIDDWQKKTDDAKVETELDLTAGKHEVKVEYFENTGAAVAKLDWTKVK